VALDLADLLARDPGDQAQFRYGTVVAANTNGTVVVALGGAQVTLPHLKHYVPTVNHNVLVLQQGQRLVVIGAFVPTAGVTVPDPPAPTPSQPAPKPPAPSTKTRITKTFLAGQTGCFRGGKWRTDTANQPHQGDWQGAYGRNTGAWFYGNSIASTLAGSKVIAAKIYMRRLSGGQFGSQAATLYTTPHPTRPGGSPTLLGSGTDLQGIPVGGSGWYSFPLALAQQYSAGTAKGLACWVNADDPYIVFAGLGDSRSSGALQLTYDKAS
jgi:hypothetical protein